MKKQSSTTFISIIMILALVLLVVLVSSVRTNQDQKVSFTSKVYVRDIPANSPIDSEGHVMPSLVDLDLPAEIVDPENEFWHIDCNDGTCVVSNIASTYFEPVGKKATFTLETSGQENISTVFSITRTGEKNDGLILEMEDGQLVLHGERLFCASVADNNTFSVTLDTLDDSKFYIDLVPSATEHMTPGEYDINYTITIHKDTPAISMTTLGIAGAFLLFAVALILMTIKDSKDYDERQQAKRGQAAMISFIVSIVCCFAIGIISKTASEFPLSIYEATFIPTIVGVITFAMIADINDAFVGYNGSRAKYIFFAWFMTIIAVLSALVPHVKSKQSDLSRSALLFAACFGAFAVEMTIKTIKDRKGAQEDEES